MALVPVPEVGESRLGWFQGSDGVRAAVECNDQVVTGLGGLMGFSEVPKCNPRSCSLNLQTLLQETESQLSVRISRPTASGEGSHSVLTKTQGLQVSESRLGIC